MQSHPLRSPLALARRPPALDRQSIPGRLYTLEGYLAHEHADVIRQLTVNNWRTPLPLPSHSRGRFTRKPAPWPTRANRPEGPLDACCLSGRNNAYCRRSSIHQKKNPG